MNNEILDLLEVLSTAIKVYEQKPTKAQSARVRKVTQQLSNELPIYRKELVNLDKEGY